MGARRKLAFWTIWTASVLTVGYATSAAGPLGVVGADADHPYCPSAYAPLPVTLAADDTRVPLDQIAAPWAALAGWDAVRPWTPGHPTDTAHTTFKHHENQTHVTVNGDTYTSDGGYCAYIDSCTVHYTDAHRTDLTILVHEAGHCLGFADHVTSTMAYERTSPGQQVCNDRDDWGEGFAYRGVMSYCEWGYHWWAEDDRAMWWRHYGPAARVSRLMDTAGMWTCRAWCDTTPGEE